MSVCKSCGAPILWTRTPAGKRMPLDPDLTAEGDMLLVETPDDGQVVCVHRSKAGAYITDVEAQGAPGRVAHWATCPQAGQHRKGARAVGLLLVAFAGSCAPAGMLCDRVEPNHSGVMECHVDAPAPAPLVDTTRGRDIHIGGPR